MRLSKKKKISPQDSEKDVSESVVEEASNEPAINNGNSNGDCEMPEEISQDEPCSIPEEPSKTTEGKGRGELKPPRVLEVIAGILI